MEIHWQALISGMFTLTVITYFIKRSAFSVKRGILKFGLFLKVFSLGCLVLSLVPLAILLTENYQVEKPGETTALIGLSVGFGIAALYMLAESFLVKGTYNKDSIRFFTPWTGKKNEHWSDLQSVHFNAWCYWYLLRFKSGKVIRISTYLEGHGHLLNFLRERGYSV
jgi:hypothetical protein